MATAASRVSVTTSATAVATLATGGADIDARSFLLSNATATESVFVGPSGVTTANGFEWKTTHPPLSITLEPGESLYGIVATNAQTVHVLSTGRTYGS